MNALKLALLVVGIALAALLGLWVIGLAFSLLQSLFWIIVILLVVVVLWKLFGPDDTTAVTGSDANSKLQNAEMTLDEYRRKIESSTKADSEKR